MSALMKNSGVVFQVLRGETIKSVTDGTRLTCDVFIVRCSAADGSNYTNVHSAVVSTQQVRSTNVIEKQHVIFPFCLFPFF